MTFQAGANRKNWLRGYVLAKVEQAVPGELLRCAAVAWSPADASAIKLSAGIPVTIAGLNEPVRTRQTVAIGCMAVSLVLSAVALTIVVFADPDAP